MSTTRKGFDPVIVWEKVSVAPVEDLLNPSVLRSRDIILSRVDYVVIRWSEEKLSSIDIAITNYSDNLISG
jgi:hypothetical protein